MRHIVLDQSSASVGDLVGEEPDAEQDPQDAEAEFGGPEARLNLERKLVRKLDMRMSILVLIYILNYVRLPITLWLRVFISVRRSTGIMLRESCNDLSLVMANSHSKRRSSGRFRGRLASDRATIQHTPRGPLCWLHLDADTFVSTHNDLPVSFSMISQQYVFELHRKAFHISPRFHDALGCYICFNRSGADFPFTPLGSCPCRHDSRLYGCRSHPILSWLRRGCLFSRCPFSPIEVVQALRAWSSYCISLVRFAY